MSWKFYTAQGEEKQKYPQAFPVAGREGMVLLSDSSGAPAWDAPPVLRSRLTQADAGTALGTAFNFGKVANWTFYNPAYFNDATGSATVITVLKGGLYLIEAHCYQTGITAGVRAECGIWANGSAKTSTREAATSDGGATHSLTYAELFAPGGTIEVRSVAPSGAVNYQGSDARYGHLFVQYLGSLPT